MSEDENNNENDKMNAERMLDAIEESLREQGLKYFSERSARATGFGMTIPSIVQRVHVVYIADDSQYTLVAQVPEDSFCSDEARKPIVAKYICRVNRFVPLGFFNFDYDSGGIGFKLSVDCHGEKPTSERIMWSLMVAMESVCAYIPGIVKVIKAERDAETLTPEPVNNVKILWSVVGDLVVDSDGDGKS